MSDIRCELLEIVNGSFARCPKCGIFAQLGSPAHKTMKATGSCTDCNRSKREQGRKDDSAKIRYSLLPVGTANQVVQVLEFGSKKYADNNWQKVPSARTRYYDAAMRHIDAWWNGELLDLDKGDQKGSHLPHLAHAICCLMFLMWFDSEAADD